MDYIFQSTRPMRGATFCRFLHSHFLPLFQSTRPMRGATNGGKVGKRTMKVFQSTRPMRGATWDHSGHSSAGSISIHAPHAGRDVAEIATHLGKSNFNPRAPCGARRTDPCPLSFGSPFQSTRPMRGATVPWSVSRNHSPLFQSTRPMRGATAAPLPDFFPGRNFNPRAPCGARRRSPATGSVRRYFNPRAPCGARRGESVNDNWGLTISIHAPHAGRDGREVHDSGLEKISIHAPHAGRDGQITGSG